ncbi:hypothetical protein RHMOL_Rhmol06G0085800 [Rhododendron molle]|uniref:Uncharacterized protein n=1 Tax=Rhododendron molle TaxID=49168 RepID=A0ACC0NA49_RHOML|nr:hypothetical protein RHMOL_Rhmol06G0085800 [Rhododendron molle]
MDSASGDEVEAVIHGGDTPTVPRKSTKRKAKAKARAKPPKAQKQGSGRPESVAWDHFDKIEAQDTADGIQRGICKYCRNEYMADPKMHGTSSMLAHITVCKKYPYNREPKGGQQTLSFEHKKDGFELVATSFSQGSARTALVEMVMLDELSFAFVEGAGFRKFCKALQPMFEPISRYTVARDVVKIFNREKAKLMNVLRGRRISLTTDTWTSIQNLNYMCLTAHFIDDDWKLHKRILNFCIVDDHKGDTIGKKIEACLLEWNIGGVFTITVDNASSNASAMRYLVKKTKDWEGTVLGHDYLHVRCCAHILNLIVSDGLEERAPSIACIREVVRYVRSSPSRLDSFKKCVLKEKIESKKYLCLDVPTRWNSTYLMLDAAQKFEKAFNRLHEEDSNFKAIFKDDEFSEGEEENENNGAFRGNRGSGENRGNGEKRKPTKEDWGDCRTFVHFLRLFYIATKRFSGSLYVTSDVFFKDMYVIQLEVEKLLKSSDILLSSMAFSMKEKLDKYWGKGDKMNLLLYVAAVLDPRKKLDYVEFCFIRLYGEDTANAMKQKVKHCLIRLFEDYVKHDKNSVEVPNVCLASASAMTIDDDFDDPHKALASQFSSYMEQQYSISSKSEVDKYLAESCEAEDDDSKFDILMWWKNNSVRYNVLSQVARDVLAFPVSTVASESAFSTGGRILDPFRSSLSPAMVEMLVCGQNWLRNDVPISLRKAMDDIEQYESYDSDEDLLLKISGSPNKNGLCDFVAIGLRI